MEQEILNWVGNNWGLILAGFMILEKIVKISPTKVDDIVIDLIVTPILDFFRGKTGQKVLIFLTLFGLTWYAVAYSATKSCVVSCDWDGKDISGGEEISFPVTIKVYDAATNELKTQADIQGAVVAFSLPPFPVEVKDNVQNTFAFYATATDSAGNVSERSVTVTRVIVGADTLSPSKPSLLSMLISFFKKVFWFVG